MKPCVKTNHIRLTNILNNNRFQSRINTANNNWLEIPIKDNFNISDFKLSDEDMKQIAKINKNERYYIRTEESLESFSKWQPEYEK